MLATSAMRDSAAQFELRTIFRLDAARLPSAALVFLDLSLHHKAWCCMRCSRTTVSNVGQSLLKVDSDEEVLSALKDGECLPGLSSLGYFKNQCRTLSWLRASQLSQRSCVDYRLCDGKLQTRSWQW